MMVMTRFKAVLLLAYASAGTLISAIEPTVLAVQLRDPRVIDEHDRHALEVMSARLCGQSGGPSDALRVDRYVL